MTPAGKDATGERRGDDHVPRSSSSLPFGGTAVVVGGGVAGTAAAAELCYRRPDARVALVARDDKVKVSFEFGGRGTRKEKKGVGSTSKV